MLFGERGIDERGAQVLISDSGLRGWYCISSGLVLRRAFADAHVLPVCHHMSAKTFGTTHVGYSHSCLR